MSTKYDVIIIGAGIVGSLTARFLSQFKLKILLIEKEVDIGMGASSANSEPAFGFRRCTFYLPSEEHIEHSRHVPDGEQDAIGPGVRLPSQVIIAHRIKGAPRHNRLRLSSSKSIRTMFSFIAAPLYLGHREPLRV